MANLGDEQSFLSGDIPTDDPDFVPDDDFEIEVDHPIDITRLCSPKKVSFNGRV